MIVKNNDIPLWEKFEKTIPSPDECLGVTFSADKKSVRFALWAPSTPSVDLMLFTDGQTQTPSASFPLEFNRNSGVWFCVLTEQDLKKIFKGNIAFDTLYYEYLVESVGFNHTKKRCLDPYALSMAAYRDDGSSGRGAVVDLDSKNARISNYTADKSDFNLHDAAKRSFHRNDAIIYEVSVRDFTISEKSCVKHLPGTFSAFSEKLSYIADLGVTHIQLMPVLNFYNNNEMLKNAEFGNSGKKNYNWGYDPHNYFTVEGWYSENPDDAYSRIKELRFLIDEIHRAGLRVILDVVYNHMAKTDFLEDIVKGYYFRLNDDGSYKSGSGCGNDLATEHLMVRRMIIDSIVHWIKNYDVDGFRFDLMGLIDSVTMLESFKAASSLKSDVLFIGEGWKMYTGGKGTFGLDQNFMTKTNDIAVFNDEYRDMLKAGGMNEKGNGFLTNQDVDMERLFYNLTGRPQVNYQVDSPADNVQYLACHDGYTLHDCIAVNAKIDEKTESGCNELYSRLRLSAAMLLTSQGIVFIHAGQEKGRTKHFVSNSYKSSDEINAFPWEMTDNQRKLFEYTKALIEFRKSHLIFRLRNLEEIKAQAALVENASGKLLLTYALYEDVCGENGGCWFLFFNARKKTAKIAPSVVFKQIRFAPAERIEKLKVFADSENVFKTPQQWDKNLISSLKNNVDEKPQNYLLLQPLSAYIVFLPA